MNSQSPKGLEDDPGEIEPEGKGPNLFILYGFLLFALLLAMAFAAMIVWPFYKHR